MWKSSSLERTWKSGSLEPCQHVPLIAGFSPGQPKGHPSSRCRGHEWPLFRAHASSCSGREETPDRKKPRCGTGSWYPPLCLQHLEKQGNGAASVCAGSGNGGPARHHVTRKCRIILFTLVIPRAFTPEESAFAPNRVPAADATPPDTPRVSAAPCRPA